MKSISTEIIIERKPDVVWNVLTDFDNYSEWNPYLISIRGVPKPGKRLRITIQLPGGRKIIFHPKILILNPPRDLRWVGGLWVPGLFKGEHYFQVLDMKNGNTLFVQGEHFKGIFVKYFRKRLEDTIDGFEMMNEALRDRCESST